MKKQNENKTFATGRSLGLFLNKHSMTISLCALCVTCMSATAFAGGNVDALWNTIATLIQTWVTRLGGVVMLIGGVMFGLGWKSDDAEQKSRGVSTIIAGAIVAAVAALTGQFFA